jgi:16S rRNA (cytosine1402-N4)-methyltransferase
MTRSCTLHFAPPRSPMAAMEQRIFRPIKSVQALEYFEDPGEFRIGDIRPVVRSSDCRGMSDYATPGSPPEPTRLEASFHHTPAMLDEVLELFEDVPDGTVLDATLGGGGHAAALLDARPGLNLIGIDRDSAAIRAATQRLARFGNRVHIVQARFDELAAITHRVLGDQLLSGVLFDLGVSTTQLDTPERGFSFRFEGPLDMRMDPRSGPTAAEILNAMSEHEIELLLRQNGESRLARRIAAAIVAAKPIIRTDQLANVVADAVPPAARRRGHPARRVFQGLRIETNGELSILPGALDDAIALTRTGGRVVVLSYHSGEDRIAKDRFSFAATGGCTCLSDLPCVCGALATVRLLMRGAKLPSEAEVRENARAEAARLRAVEVIDPVPPRSVR